MGYGRVSLAARHSSAHVRAKEVLLCSISLAIQHTNLWWIFPFGIRHPSLDAEQWLCSESEQYSQPINKHAISVVPCVLSNVWFLQETLVNRTHARASTHGFLDCGAICVDYSSALVSDWCNLFLGSTCQVLSATKIIKQTAKKCHNLQNSEERHPLPQSKNSPNVGAKIYESEGRFLEMLDDNHVPEENIQLDEVVDKPLLFSFRGERRCEDGVDERHFVVVWSGAATFVVLIRGELHHSPVLAHSFGVRWQKQIIRGLWNVFVEERSHGAGSWPFRLGLLHVVEELVAEPVALADELGDVVFGQVQVQVTQHFVNHLVTKSKSRSVRFQFFIAIMVFLCAIQGNKLKFGLSAKVKSDLLRVSVLAHGTHSEVFILCLENMVNSFAWNRKSFNFGANAMSLWFEGTYSLVIQWTSAWHTYWFSSAELTTTVLRDDLVEAHAPARVEVRLQRVVGAFLPRLVAVRVRLVDVLDVSHAENEHSPLETLLCHTSLTVCENCLLEPNVITWVPLSARIRGESRCATLLDAHLMRSSVAWPGRTFVPSSLMLGSVPGACTTTRIPDITEERFWSCWVLWGSLQLKHMHCNQRHFRDAGWVEHFGQGRETLCAGLQVCTLVRNCSQNHWSRTMGVTDKTKGHCRVQTKQPLKSERSSSEHRAT